MTTIESRLIATKFRPTGFDYMRIVLASCIVLYHTVVTSYGVPAQVKLNASVAGPFIGLLVPMFFALSGFLVAGSLARTKTVISLLGLRMLRIWPALFVETLLSACLLGSIFTTLPLREYFTSSELYSYLWNFVGYIHYYLPGVFTHNPSTMVNGQLWTIPAELACYLVLTGLFMFGFVRWRFMLILCTVLLQLYAIRNGIKHPLTLAFILPEPLLVFAFVTGVTFYRWGDRIPWDWRLAACAGAWALLAPVFIHGIGIHLTPIATTYLTVYLGLQNPKKWWVLSTGDYSYGMYLYGYPIQQAVMAMNPALRHWWINLLIAYPLAAAFAFASWHLVEKHALKLKGRLLRAENSAISTTQMGQRGLKSFRARWKQESNV